MRKLLVLALFGIPLVYGAGCSRQVSEPFVDNALVGDLSPELQTLVRTVLAERCGTSAQMKLLGQDVDREHLRRGQDVFNRQCAQCHGTSGDGNGEAAKYLFPRPRDYRRGIFKYTSTPYGAKPLRSDLERTVRNGIMGTSMPAFELHSKEDIDAVIDYVLALTHRGELEILLAAEADSSEELSSETVDGFVTEILDQWAAAERQTAEPVTPMPVYSPETVEAGRQAFMTKGCAKCHGADGRGRSKDNVGTDSWGFTTFAADLTSGMLHGGTQPKDIYRRIHAGINGTPMPMFRDALAAEPETIWNLVHYVEHVSAQRRSGHFPEFEPVAELPGAEATPAEAPAAEAATDTAPAADAPAPTESAPAETPAEADAAPTP